MRAIALTLVAGLCLPVPVAAQGRPQQREHRSGFRPADSTVFAILTRFYAYDRSLPMADRVVDEWDDEHGRYRKVVFTTQSGARVPGLLALPLAGDGPYPAVLLLHGLGNARDRWWQDDRVALPNTLLESGIAVLAIDLARHGERSVENDYQSPVYLTLGDSLFVRNRDMIIQSAIDARRALDYLRARSDIDAARLGVAGYSMGGMIALYLAALEPTLQAVVASAVPTTEQPIPIDPFQFAPRSRVPVLLQIGRTDWLSSRPDVDRLLTLMPAGMGEVAWYDSGHVLPGTFAPDAARWLRARVATSP